MFLPTRMHIIHLKADPKWEGSQGNDGLSSSDLKQTATGWRETWQRSFVREVVRTLSHHWQKLLRTLSLSSGTATTFDSWRDWDVAVLILVWYLNPTTIRKGDISFDGTAIRKLNCYGNGGFSWLLQQSSSLSWMASRPKTWDKKWRHQLLPHTNIFCSGAIYPVSWGNWRKAPKAPFSSNLFSQKSKTLINFHSEAAAGYFFSQWGL